jgi:menaquinone-dependent protoporphyrinogen IX oxidase
MTNALIVYGTRYGATASTSEEIANVLRQEGLEVQVVDAKKEKIKDVSKHDPVVVGSGIQMEK